MSFSSTALLNFPKCYFNFNKKDHSLVLCEEQGQRYLYTMGDNTYQQLCPLKKKQIFVPIKVKCKYNVVGTFNRMSFGMIRSAITNKVEIRAWGFFKIVDQPTKKVQVAKLIEEPRTVDCSSFNELVERYTKTLTYFWVHKDNSPTLNRINYPDPFPVLIDESFLSIVHYVYEENQDESQ